MSKSEIKSMHITFFDIKGIIHLEFIPLGQAVSQAYYVKHVLEQLHEAVRRKRPELWLNNWILRHDSAPANKALSFNQFVAEKSITEMEHTPYSADLDPNNFWLFPKINSVFKGRRFQDIENIQKNMTTLKATVQQEFQKCFQQWQHR
jgi:hypothetical protein